MKYKEFIDKMGKINLVRRILIDKKFNEIGVYYGQPPILRYVLEHPNCTQVEIADCFNISPASIATSTKRMMKNGLLTKMVDENNLRCNKLIITEKGRKLFQQCTEIFNEVDQLMFKDFNEKELEKLNSYFDRLLDNICGDEYRNIDRLKLCLIINKQKGEKHD